MMIPPEQNLLVVDLETTGPNPVRHDVLAVGMVPLHDISRAVVFYVRPAEPQWSPFAKTNFKRFESVWERQAVSSLAACELIEDYLRQEFQGAEVTPIGHNIGFDVAFLRKLAFAGGRDELRGISRRALDTHTMLYLLFLQGRIPANALSSDGAFEHFGIRVVPEARHTALGDALATHALATKLLDMLAAPFLAPPHINASELRGHSARLD